MNGGIAIVAAAIVAYSALAARLDRRSVTPAMVFTLTGILLGPKVLDLLAIHPDSESVKLLTEITLALLLFADASTMNPAAAIRAKAIDARLLLVGLPLTVGLGTLLAALLFPDEGWAWAALVATLLAPTDAALGMAVFTNRSVPVRVRRWLNVESGLNDGIATPLVTLFIALVASEEGFTGAGWLAHTLKEIGIGVGVGLGVGIIGGRLMLAARGWGATTAVSEEVAVLALAAAAYFTALWAGGNGFIAAFVGGLALAGASAGRLAERSDFTETTGFVLTLVVWTIFGAVLAGPALAEGFDARVIGFALLALTVMRMLPVALSLVGVGLRRDTVAFMGWFGPRGLASVVFALLAFDGLEGSPPAQLVLRVASWTILLSIVAHGLSAVPFARRYAARVAGADPSALELEDAPEPRTRRRTLLQP